MVIYNVYTDGGARGNPGPAGAGVVVFDGENNQVVSIKKYLGSLTNNQAEYQALLMACEWLKGSGLSKVSHVNFFLDSELVVKQIKGEYKIKNLELRKLADEVLAFINSAKFAVKIEHIRREKNTFADTLVNEVLDEQGSK